MTVIRPATPQDVVAFLGHPPQFSAVCDVAEKDGKIVAIGGFYWSWQTVFLFSQILDEFRSDKRAIVAYILSLQDRLKEFKSPVYSVALKTEPGSESIMRRLKFKHVGETEHGKLYVYRGQQLCK